MNLQKQGSLAVTLFVAAGIAPGALVHGQRVEPVARAFDVISHAGRIGVSVRDLEADDTKQAKTGVIVDEVGTGSPADKAGVKTGDAITEFDGERVRSVRQFTRLVQETPAGRSVPLVLSRGGQRSTVNITPERSSFDDGFAMRLLEAPRARPAVPPAPATPRPPSMLMPAVPYEFPGLRMSTGRRLGVTLEGLDDQLAQYFGVKEGALVKSVTDGSSAQKAGVKAGDVITAINGRHVYDASDVNRALDRMENTDEYSVEIVRDKKPQTLKGKLEPRDTRARVRARTIL
jgi:serine protease Do